jgi:peptidoglycan hydrolase-like protein with peptidoglycan-binding domain
MPPFPTKNLQPGATGQDVRQLQDYLVSRGYMTQAQVNTGYGTYGPQTTRAVQKLQQDFGVDSSTGPGYWGPRTIQAVSSFASNQPSPSQFRGANFVQPIVPSAPSPISSLPGDQTGALSIEQLLSQRGEGTARETGEGAGVGLNLPTRTEPPASQFQGADFVQPASQVPGQDASSAFLDELISLNPFIQDQLKDPATKAKFDALPAELKPAYYQLLDQLGKSIETGQMVNPDIEITPAQLAEFTTKATAELDPYYQEQIGLIRRDLETSLSRIQEDFQREAQRAQEPFKQTLAQQSETEALAGTTFGSERANRERRLVLRQQQALDDALRASLRSGQDIGSQAERQIGSSAVAGVSNPLLSSFQVSPQGFSQGARQISFTPQGNLLGTLPKSREVAIQGRTTQLEEAERRNRILDLQKLS